MRRIDPFTLAFFMQSLQSSRLANATRSRRQPPEPESADDELGDEPINSWESAWIDLGGEG